MFGKAFFREHGAEPNDLWGKAIARLTDRQVIEGLGNLGNDDLQFPANLSQFVSACKRQPEATGVRHLGVPYEPLSLEDRGKEERKHLADVERLKAMRKKYGNRYDKSRQLPAPRKGADADVETDLQNGTEGP